MFTEQMFFCFGEFSRLSISEPFSIRVLNDCSPLLHAQMFVRNLFLIGPPLRTHILKQLYSVGCGIQKTAYIQSLKDLQVSTTVLFLNISKSILIVYTGVTFPFQVFSNKVHAPQHTHATCSGLEGGQTHVYSYTFIKDT